MKSGAIQKPCANTIFIVTEMYVRYAAKYAKSDSYLGLHARIYETNHEIFPTCYDKIPKTVGLPRIYPAQSITIQHMIM